MENVFLNILNMSLTAGIIIIAVLIIRLFLRKLPKKYSYFLWSVVGFRLLCPVSFSSAVSIFNLKIFSRMNITGGENNVGGKLAHINDVIGAAAKNSASSLTTSGASGATGAVTDTVTGTISEATGTVSGAVGDAVTGAISGATGATYGAVTDAVTGAISGAMGTASGAVGDAVTGAISEATGTASGAVGDAVTGAISETAGTTADAIGAAGNIDLSSLWNTGWFRALAVVWLVGMAVMLIYGIVTYIIMTRRIENAIWVKENVYRCDKITSPFVFGIIRPKVYIPAFIDVSAAEYVMQHENYHIKRRDYIVKPIAFVLLCFHWFNPLVWTAFYMMGRDMEMSCDEAVLTEMITQQGRMKNGMSESDVVKGYSYALLNCASQGSFGALFQLGFGELRVRDRIKNVLKYKKYGWFITAALVFVCMFVLVACGTNSNDEKEKIENPMTPELMLQMDEAVKFTSSRDFGQPWSSVTELEVKIVNDTKGNSIIAWDGLKCRLDENIIPAGIYQYSNGVDIDGDGEDERIIECWYSVDDNNTYKTLILDKNNGGLLCLGLPSWSIATARAYDNFILEIKFDFEYKTRRYDCSNPGKNEFLKELRQSLIGKVWDEDGKLLNPDSKDGLSKSVPIGLGMEKDSAFYFEIEDERAILAEEIGYNVDIWLNDASNTKFNANLKYKPENGSMVLERFGCAVIDTLASGEFGGQLGANCELVENETSQDIELDFSDTPRKWTEQKLEIARSLYKDFTPCAANIDGEWVKSLYNDEHDVLIVQESNAYGIYHGEEYISVSFEMPFPTDNYVSIKFVDANDDGTDELYLSAYGGGFQRVQLIGLEPLTALVDSYNSDGTGTKLVQDYVKEYSITNVWVAEDDNVHVLAEIVMNSGQTYQTECVVAGADKEKLDAFVIEPVFFHTNISGEYPYAVNQDIRFRVNQGSMLDGNGYIFMTIRLKYDEESNHYIESGEVKLYYKEISPANWG